ncbi:MAG: molybdopterin-dependent oxidoreductase [Halococcoides sp.]
MQPATRLGARDGMAAVASIAAVAGSYAAAGRQPAFLVAPVERALSRAMPGSVIEFAIAFLGSLGQELNLLVATGLTIVGLTVLIRLTLPTADRPIGFALAPILTALGTWVLATGLTGAPVIAIAAALPAAAVVAIGLAADRFPAGDYQSDSRRAILTAIAGGSVGLIGYLVGQSRSAPEETDPVPGPTVDHEAIESALAVADARNLEYDGLDPLVSEDFYQVSINAIDPSVNREDWSLSITGAVDTEIELDFEDILQREAENRFVTLRCVGESLNGKQCDTALWTGVPVADLLEETGPLEGREAVMLHGADDYYVEFPLAALEPGLLAYGMNGAPLPRGHGAPLRALVPGHWGEVNTKWLTEIEVLERPAVGYWEARGWHGTGPVSPVTKLYTTRDRPDGRRLLGGFAYAGTRGVTRVEVSTDGGSTWTDADLSESLDLDEEIIGPQSDAPHDAWRQWALVYDPPATSHEVVVRLIDGDGDLQPRERGDRQNSGAFGWVSQELSGR